MPDNVAVFATTILVLPMFYLLLASPAFLLVKLEIIPVARLLRGMFNSYFIVLTIAGAIGTTAVALTGRWGLAIGFGLLTALAAMSRRAFSSSELKSTHLSSNLRPRSVGLILVTARRTHR